MADGFQLKTWRGGPNAGKLKLSPAAKGLVERGLMRLDMDQRLQRLVFTEAGRTELRVMISNRRFADPKTFAHIRRELGIAPMLEAGTPGGEGTHHDDDHRGIQQRRLDRVFKFLGWPKSHFFAGLDLDGLTGRRVAPHAGSPGFDFQDAETAHADAIALLQVGGHGRHKVCKQTVNLFLRQGVHLPKLLEHRLQRDDGRGGRDFRCCGSRFRLERRHCRLSCR